MSSSPPRSPSLVRGLGNEMTGNSAQLAHENRERAKRMLREVKKASRKCEIRMHNTALWKFSNGPVKQVTLSKPPPGLNNPYGIGLSNRRGPRGAVPNGGPGVINLQTGDFAASWDTYSVLSPSKAIVTLFNYSEHAQFLKGTDKMRPRPVREMIASVEFPLFSWDMANAWRKAINP